MVLSICESILVEQYELLLCVHAFNYYQQEGRLKRRMHSFFHRHMVILEYYYYGNKSNQ